MPGSNWPRSSAAPQLRLPQAPTPSCSVRWATPSTRAAGHLRRRLGHRRRVVRPLRGGRGPQILDQVGQAALEQATGKFSSTGDPQRALKKWLVVASLPAHGEGQARPGRLRPGAGKPKGPASHGGRRTHRPVTFRRVVLRNGALRPLRLATRRHDSSAAGLQVQAPERAGLPVQGRRAFLRHTEGPVDGG